MGVADDFAPSFTQKPQLRQEDDGNRLIFECQLISAPKPEISWYRGETELSADARTNFRMQSIGTNKFLVVLELDDVIETDAGLYKVKAKNKMGEVAASINLNFSREYLPLVATFFFLFLPIVNCVTLRNALHATSTFATRKIVLLIDTFLTPETLSVSDCPCPYNRNTVLLLLRFTCT